MKNSNKRIIILIAAVCLVFAIAFVIFTAKVNNSKYQEFRTSGYIISTDYKTGNMEDNEVSSMKQYFNASTKYKQTYNNEIVFVNSSNEKTTVNSDNFIHYEDGSISTLKLASILDLDSINSPIITYYNLLPNNLLAKNGEKYTAKNLNEDVNFTNFIIKINDNKYIIVSPNMSVNIKENAKTINGYVELHFFDGNIVRIENNDTKIQSAADGTIQIGSNIIIDLADKNIYYDKKYKMNLNDITISMDDNVTLSDSDVADYMTAEEKIEAEKKAEEEKNAKQKAIEEAKEKLNSTFSASFDMTNPLNGISSGKVNTINPDDTEVIIDDSENNLDPIFTISSFETSANSVSAGISYEDKSSALASLPTVTLVDAASNKEIDRVVINNGLTTFNYVNQTLSQNTNYVLVVTATYNKNDQLITKDFIQKSFYTSGVGISVRKNYFTDSSLSFYIDKEIKSDVSKLNAVLYNDYGELVGKEEVYFDSENKIVNFENLQPNTKYILKLQDFEYKNNIVKNNFDIVEEYTTLKERPELGELTYTIDKVSGKFNLAISNIIDRNDSIKKIQYLLYDSRTMTAESTGDPVKIYDSLEGAEVIIDGEKVSRGVPYVYKVIVTYYDNEKEVEIEKGFSQPMQLDGKKHPYVRFDPEIVTFERIAGMINIIDDSNTVDINQPITIIYTDSHGISKTKKFANVEKQFVIDFGGLRANNESYIFNVYGTVDLDDNYGPTEQLIGTFVVNTSDIKSFNLETVIDSTDATKSFKIYAKLGSVNNQDNTLEANTLSGLTFNLYEGEGTTGTKIKSIPFVDQNEDPYVSDLKSIYYDSQFVIDEKLFGISSNSLRQYKKVTIEVTNAHDYTQWPNVSPIINNVITVELRTTINDPGELLYTLIRNKNVDQNHYNSSLDDETVAAIEMHNTYANDGKFAKYVSYNIYNINDPDNPIVSIEKLPVYADGSIPTHTFYFEKGTPSDIKDKTLTRGNTYYATSKVYVDVNGDGIIDEDTNINLEIKSREFEIPKQQPKFQTFPSTFENNNLIWSYKYSDYDYALVGDTLYYRWNNIDNGHFTITESDEFKNIELPFSTTGEINLYTVVLLNKNDNNTQMHLLKQIIEEKTTAPEIKYIIIPELNRISLSIINYDKLKDFFNKVTDVKVTLTNGAKLETIDGLSFDNSGNLVVNLFKFSSLANSDVTVSLTIYYDSNIIGFDTEPGDATDYTKNFSLKQAQDGLGTGTYYWFKNNKLQSSAYAKNSIFSFALNKTPNFSNLYEFNLYDVFGNHQTYNLALDSGGFMFTDNNEYIHFYPSKISKRIATTENSTFHFGDIIPSISLKKNNRYTINPEINTCLVDIDLQAQENSIQDNKIYISLYKSDKNMLESYSTFVYEKVVSIDELTNIVLDNLEKDTYYYFKVSAIMRNSGQKVSLYDSDASSANIKYPFLTLSSLSVSNEAFSFNANSYNDKKLTYNYTLNTTRNLAKIAYRVYRVDIDEDDNKNYYPLTMNISDDVSFLENMDKIIDVSPETGFLADNTYVIGLTGYLLQSNGELVELEEIYSSEYNFSKLQETFFYVNYNRDVDNNSLSFNIYLNDKQKTLVDGEYEVRIHDENDNDITPTDLANEKIKTSKLITLENIDLYKSYTIYINYRVNTSNTNIEDDIVTKSKYNKINALNVIGVDTGDIYVTVGENSRINLIFTNFTNLNLVKNIRYEIYKDGNSILNRVGYENFTPTLDVCGTSSCSNYSLNVSISDYGIYYIQMQFLSENGTVIDERTISYAYSL